MEIVDKSVETDMLFKISVMMGINKVGMAALLCVQFREDGHAHLTILIDPYVN